MKNKNNSFTFHSNRMWFWFHLMIKLYPQPVCYWWPASFLYHVDFQWICWVQFHVLDFSLHIILNRLQELCDKMNVSMYSMLFKQNGNSLYSSDSVISQRFVHIFPKVKTRTAKYYICLNHQQWSRKIKNCVTTVCQTKVQFHCFDLVFHLYFNGVEIGEITKYLPIEQCIQCSSNWRNISKQMKVLFISFSSSDTLVELIHYYYFAKLSNLALAQLFTEIMIVWDLPDLIKPRQNYIPFFV